MGANGRAYAALFYPSMQEIWPELYSTGNIRVVEVGFAFVLSVARPLEDTAPLFFPFSFLPDSAACNGPRVAYDGRKRSQDHSMMEEVGNVMQGTFPPRQYFATPKMIPV